MTTEYDFVEAIKETIENCKVSGYSIVQRKDTNGNITLWLEAEWVKYDNKHNVIELYICFSDTGKVAYSKYIMETLIKTV